MSKPFYKSKKFWTALVTALVQVACEYFDKPELLPYVTGLGMSLVAGFGLADFGKEKTGPPISIPHIRTAGDDLELPSVTVTNVSNAEG